METRDMVRRYYERVWRDGDVDAIDEFLTEDHTDETPPPGFDGTRESQKQIAAMMRDTSKDKSMDVIDIVVDDDRRQGVLLRSTRSTVGRCPTGSARSKGA